MTALSSWFLTRAERGNPDTAIDARRGDGSAWTEGNLVRPLVHGATYYRRLLEALAELGPGDSLGVGLAAILCGTRRYFALDVHEYTNPAAALRMLNELVALFRRRAPRAAAGWPDFDAYLDERLFPSHILTDARLSASLSEERIARIRDAIASPTQVRDGICVQYIVPWSDARVLVPGSVDLVLSHAMLQHVVDLEATYRALGLWVKPGGLMSHQVDLQSHGSSGVWNGYRAYPESLWRMMVGKRLYFINREPPATHIRLLQANGFAATCVFRATRADGIDRSRLAARWRDISDEDLNCSGVYFQARRVATSGPASR